MDTLLFENAFLASPRVSNLAHFQHVLWTSFQVRFLSDFVSFLEPFEAPFGTIFGKKTIPKIVRPQLIRMDALGRRVKELTDEEKAIGYKTLEEFNLLQQNKLF